jgi:hypothetical protein
MQGRLAEAEAHWRAALAEQPHPEYLFTRELKLRLLPSTHSFTVELVQG